MRGDFTAVEGHGHPLVWIISHSKAARFSCCGLITKRLFIGGLKMLTYVPIVFSFFGEFSQLDGKKKAPGESNKGIFQIFSKKFAIC